MRNKKHLQTTLILSLVFLISCFSPANISAQKTVNKNLTPRQIAQQTLPSTVLLVMSNSNTEEVKSGSGFFIAEDIVATNFHVIKETTEGYAKIYGQDKIYEILGVVGIDENNDLALIKIKGIKGKALKLNADDLTAIGDEVFAVGNPKGLEGTFSQGIVSSIRKTNKLNLLQITASISAGSSGGAVLNDDGEVIGVAVGAIESGQSLNFAIPVSLLRSLISNQKTLAALKSNITITNNKTQSNSNKITQQPNNTPTIKPNPQKPSRMQFKTSDLVKENLFGKLQSTKELIYIPEKKFEEWVLGEAVSIFTETYNLDGNKESSEEIIYSEKDAADYVAKVYIYNDGKDIELPFAVKRLYYYDYPNHFEIQENYIKCASCSVYVLQNKFLSKFQNGEETGFKEDGEVLWKRIERKDKNGKFVIEQFDENGKLYYKEIIYKNTVGEIKEIWNPSKSNKDQFELSSKTVTTETQNELKESYLCVNEKRYPCGKITVRDKLTKLILREAHPTSEILKFDYEFDQNRNWTKKTESQQVTKFGKTYFEPIKITVREISYY